MAKESCLGPWARGPWLRDLGYRTLVHETRGLDIKAFILWIKAIYREPSFLPGQFPECCLMTSRMMKVVDVIRQDILLLTIGHDQHLERFGRGFRKLVWLKKKEKSWFSNYTQIQLWQSWIHGNEDFWWINQNPPKNKHTMEKCQTFGRFFLKPYWQIFIYIFEFFILIENICLEDCNYRLTNYFYPYSNSQECRNSD